MKKIALSIVIAVILFSTYLSNSKKPYQQSIAGIKTSTNETTVSLSIGEFRFTLYGHTSPSAKVTISGLGIFDETYADKSGYFIFNNRFSPFSPREACLTAQDVFGRLSVPLCLPPFPTAYNVEIGPVIMPPTVSADVGEYFVGDEAMLSGQTMPNTEVDLTFFAGKRETTPNRAQNNVKFSRNFAISFASFSVISQVEAYSIPELKTKSDSKGNYSISIPTNNATTLRAFARATYEDSPSPKSLTLNIKILPWWMIILKIFGLIFGLLKKYLLEISLLTEFIVLTLILTKYVFHPHRLTKTRMIVLREKRELLNKMTTSLFGAM